MECIFVGHDPKCTEYYKVIDINTGRLFTSRDVVFDEDKFLHPHNRNKVTGEAISLEDARKLIANISSIQLPFPQSSTAPVPGSQDEGALESPQTLADVPEGEILTQGAPEEQEEHQEEEDTSTQGASDDIEDLDPWEDTSNVSDNELDEAVDIFSRALESPHHTPTIIPLDEELQGELIPETTHVQVPSITDEQTDEQVHEPTPSAIPTHYELPMPTLRKTFLSPIQEEEGPICIQHIKYTRDLISMKTVEGQAD